ncbi:MAG: hypothetical protein J6A17_04580 [Bacilli bacterium]|nr:hypothetical protein [Bacilli bacterium]
MKLIKRSFKIIIGFILGMIVSGISVFAATSYAINSNKVGYTDNSGLGVDNVQAAIDGTCANIDTRLGDLENISAKHELTYSSNSYYSMNGINGTHNNWYQIGKLVIVNISVKVNDSSATSAAVPKVFTGLPEPLYMANYGTLAPETYTGTAATVALYSGGNIGILGGTTNTLLNGQIIYVAK